MIYVPAVGLSKVAILIFYLRLNPARKFRIAVYTLLFIVWGWMTAIVLATIFQCQPINKLWQPLVPGQCDITGRLFLSNSILNVITDFFVLLIPIPMVIRLQVSTRQKWVVLGLFTVGSLCVLLASEHNANFW